MIDRDSQFQPDDFSFILSLIIEEEDVDLCRILNVEEVYQVVFSIDPDSALNLMVSVVDLSFVLGYSWG